MVQTLIGVLVGGLLTLTTSVVVEARREHRAGRKAARLIQQDVLEAIVTAAGVNGLFPFPLKSAAWDAYRDDLVMHVSTNDLISLSNFFMQNELVALGQIDPPLSSEIQRRGQTLMPLFNRAAESRPQRLSLRVRSALRETLMDRRHPPRGTVADRERPAE